MYWILAFNCSEDSVAENNCILWCGPPTDCYLPPRPTCWDEFETPGLNGPRIVSLYFIDSQTRLSEWHCDLIISIHLSGVSTYPCFILYIMCIRDQTNDHLIFYFQNQLSNATAYKVHAHNRYDKMLWRQIVSNNNDIGSYKTQLCVQSFYTYAYNKMPWWQMYRHISLICKIAR